MKPMLEVWAMDRRRRLEVSKSGMLGNLAIHLEDPKLPAVDLELERADARALAFWILEKTEIPDASLDTLCCRIGGIPIEIRVVPGTEGPMFVSRTAGGGLHAISPKGEVRLSPEEASKLLDDSWREVCARYGVEPLR